MSLKIAMVQSNPTVGDLKGNAKRLTYAFHQAAQQGAELIVTPEVALTGYPLDDLVNRPSFMEAVRQTVENLAAACAKGPPVLLGTPWEDEDGVVMNAALLLRGGCVTRVIEKRVLANGGPFHELRNFASGHDYRPIRVKNHKIGVAVCADIWDQDVPEQLKDAGAEMIVVMNGSPFGGDKGEEREAAVRRAARSTSLPIAYVNMVGGQDELMFDGGSFVMDGKGDIKQQFPVWEEQVGIASFKGKALEPQIGPRHEMDATQSLYTAAMLGIRDYARKNGFKSAVIGLSGGIDSALTLAMACDALGAENVQALMLPSEFTSQESKDVARRTAEMLGCAYSEDLTIDAPFAGMKAALAKRWDNPKSILTEQNIQARLRTLFLFAVSNDEGRLVLNTSNKSEVAMGHSTFYGDTSGGYAPLKDLWKTQVYELAAWRNKWKPRLGYGPEGAVIDARILTRAPTPELAHGEVDTDILPPYDVLDPILKALVEDEESVEDIVGKGFDRAIVKSVYDKMCAVEFKRFQTPPGPRVSERSFGRRERMYPLTNKYRDFDYGV